jgi:UDP-N-acetylmuramate dehydrogenase
MIRSEIPLKNTLALQSSADHVAAVGSVADARDAIEFGRAKGAELRCLGEGSNVILMPRVSGLICHVTQAEVCVVDSDAESVTIAVGAGKNWHELVQETLAQNWFGLENLALIPGSVGAAPVQNIGAYGVELAERLVSVDVVQGDGSIGTLNAVDCEFGYRDSIFKRQGVVDSQTLLILGVTLRLSKRPSVNLSYRDLSDALGYRGTKHSALPSPQQVSDAVISIRRAKLPDPDEYPNAGSFFKNPVVDAIAADRLRALGATPYAFKDGFKVSAAQLIDLAGWKGRRQGDVGCWQQQPLVLINYGQATAQNVLDFAHGIQRSVSNAFQVELEPEPSVLS